MLRLPDLSRSFVVDTDACVNATGAVLLQEYSDGLHPWLSTLLSTTLPNVTMVLGTRSCLLSYRHVPSGIVTLRAYLPKFTLIMSLTKHCILSLFCHVVRLAGWSG